MTLLSTRIKGLRSLTSGLSLTRFRDGVVVIDPTDAPAIIETITPISPWDGTQLSGGTPPVDPVATVKPIAHFMVPDRQVVTPNEPLTIGVEAWATNGNTLLPDCGIDYVDFWLEGAEARATDLSIHNFTRFDGSPYQKALFAVNLAMPTLEGDASLYARIVPFDQTKSPRVIGPLKIGYYNDRYDFSRIIDPSGNGDHLNVGSASTEFRSLGASRPRMQMAPGTEHRMGGGSTHTPQFWCTVEALTAGSAVVFKELPPALAGDFTRMSPAMRRMHFKGPEITLDFVESLQYVSGTSNLPSPETDTRAWLDGCRVIQSRGRDDLWRLGPRNIVPALFSGGVWATDCYMSDVNDGFDRAELARGCITENTWADLYQNAIAVTCCKGDNHSSAFYYTNVDAMSIAYSGSGTPTVSIRNSPRRLVLRVDGADVATFTASNAEQDFRDDNNYRVQAAVDFVNAQADWSATLLDDTRQAVSLSPPGTVNGAPQEDIAIPATLPTHFDIHSDWYQLTINPGIDDNILISYNSCIRVDAQDIFLQRAPGANNFAVIGNTFYNNIAPPGEPELGDESLRSGLGGMLEHGIFAHNSMATQRVGVNELGSPGGPHSLIANNYARRFSVSGGGDFEASIALLNNHVEEDFALPPEAVGTTVGGDSLTNFVDGPNGDFRAAGSLLANIATPVILYDQRGSTFTFPDVKGAIS